jgi:hypothetical protein
MPVFRDYVLTNQAAENGLIINGGAIADFSPNGTGAVRLRERH